MYRTDEKKKEKKYAYVIVMDTRAMTETRVNSLSHRCAAVSAEDDMSIDGQCDLFFKAFFFGFFPLCL